MSSDYTPEHVALSLPSRITLSIFSGIVALSGTLGNFLVWYGSIYHSAIRMEPCSRVLITNLALVDILISLILFLPLTLTLGTGQWFLGHLACVVQGVAVQVAICLEIFIMMSLNVYRLWAVRRTPGERERVRVWHVYVLLLLVLLLCCSIPLVHLALAEEGGIQADFDTRVGVCRMFLVRDYRQNFIDLVFLVPPLVISFTASKILKCVVCYSGQRSGSASARKTQRALSLVCWAMIGSYLPGYITLCWEMADSNVPDSMYLARTFIMSLNLVVNPVIYFMYSSSFNSFVKRFLSPCSFTPLRANEEQTETNGTKNNTNI